jgi:hypothetical protein
MNPLSPTLTLRDSAPNALAGSQPVATYCPHPLRPGEERILVHDQMYEGETIAQYLDRTGLTERIGHRPVRVTVDGYRVPRELLHKCRPRRGTKIQIQAVVQGDDASKIVRTVLMVALVVYTGPAGLGLTGWAAAGVIVGGGIVINALFPPPRPNPSGAQRPALIPRGP